MAPAAAATIDRAALQNRVLTPSFMEISRNLHDSRGLPPQGWDTLPRSIAMLSTCIFNPDPPVQRGTTGPGRWALAVAASIAAAAFFAPAIHAAELEIPHSFTAGTPAVASQVNANFDAVETAVDDNDDRIAALEALVVTLQSQVTTLQSEVTTLQSQNSSQQSAISAIQSSNVMGIDPYVSVTDIDDPNSSDTYATVRLSGVNLQVVNGTGETTGTVNGLGNLIVGYNETVNVIGNPSRCSSGQYDDESTCESNGAVWSRNHRSGSHNFVAGKASSYSSHSGIVNGLYNAVTARYASATAGNSNTASGVGASVAGGSGNSATSTYASVSGGSSNLASGGGASVSGGNGNTADGSGATIGGGSGNFVSGIYSTVSGGYQNASTANYATVGGGRQNEASGLFSSVSGGDSREASGSSDWRAGSLFEDQ